MKYLEFLGEVQNRAHLSSPNEAERAVRATLQTLGRRLFGGEAEDLAAQLPREIAPYLTTAGAGEKLGLDEFIDSICRQEGVGPAEATKHARAVFSVLKEAVSSGEIKDVRSQLPKEIAAFFGEGPGKGVMH
jgi:uncharacterized protein (DUF2267 family)